MFGSATRPLRIVCTLLPATGSLHALLPLVRVLRSRGHEIVMLSAAGFRSDIDRHGLSSAPAGLDFRFADPSYFSILLAEAGVQFPDLAGPARYAWVVPNLFIRAAARRTLPDVISFAKDWSADLIVRESLEFSGCVAAERLGIPHVSVAAAANCALDAGAALSSALAELRVDAGLPPGDAAAMLYRHLHVCCTPPCFDGPNARYPATASFYRHVNAVPAAPLPHWIASLPRRPNVVVSLGTVFYRTPGVYEAILAALRDEPVNLLVAAGAEENPARLGPQPANVHIRRTLPVSALLPDADLFITHGGFNSVKEALSAGTPMAVIPLGGDQHYAAARCAALGVGAAVAPDSRTPETIRATATRVLHEPAYRQAAANVRARIHQLPDLAHAVRQIEQLCA